MSNVRAEGITHPSIDALLDKTVLLDLLLRWESYTRRSNSLPPSDGMETSDQLIGMVSATLVL